MNFFSINNRSTLYSFKEALQFGIAPDGGLFMPSAYPKISSNLYSERSSLSNIAFEVIKNFLKDIPTTELRDLVESVFNFPSPLIQLDDNLFVLELFHGPTYSFKDFGARFLAHFLSYYSSNTKQDNLVLAATSGDTGSAVANAFYDMPGFKVVILYPSRLVSKIQEMQLTTLSKNVTAFEVNGSFDDCQSIVKSAFADKLINSKFTLTSANSINIGRLIPQAFYYINAFSKLKDKKHGVVFSVPSGNLGNLTAGLLAKQFGLPVTNFIASVNRNNVFQNFLSSGVCKIMAPIPTLSNAMDVSNPSNLIRIQELYKYDLVRIKNDVSSFSFSDSETISAIKEVYSNYNYICDPHTAVSYLGAKSFIKDSKKVQPVIILSTAHPAKFQSTVENCLNIKIQMPNSLHEILSKQKQAQRIDASFEEFRNALLKN